MNPKLLTTQEIAGGEMMKKMTNGLNRVLWLIAVVLVVLLSQTPVQGATNCADDSDCDGFSNAEEASPIAGVQTVPTKADLFVILEPASSGSILPPSPLGTLIDSASDIGLMVHQTANPQPGTVRNVTASQKAVKVLESLYVGSYWGYSPQGNPDTIPDDGASIVYTKKITDSVTGACSNKRGNPLTYCYDAADGAASYALQAVINKSIRFTTAHEVSHQLNLKYTCASDIGCHYPVITSASQTPTIMDQTVFYVTGRSGTTWYIGSKYNSADTNFQLRP